MKRILFLWLFLIPVLTTPVYAQSRGVLTNVYASWMNVTAGTLITLPGTSRDITIINGDATDGICVDLRGNTITSNCLYGAASTVVHIGAQTELSLYDFTTTAIYLKPVSAATAASPVSVVVTY